MTITGAGRARRTDSHVTWVCQVRFSKDVERSMYNQGSVSFLREAESRVWRLRAPGSLADCGNA